MMNINQLREGPAPGAAKQEKEESWTHLAEEYDFSEEDKANGLEKFLYESKNIAAKAAGNLFFEVGLKPQDYQYVIDTPLGLDRESDAPEKYYPGEYGIVVGRKSKQVEAFLEGNDSEKLKNTLAVTFVHEIVHMMLTDKITYIPDGPFGTVGNTVIGWYSFEESMAEAIGMIAIEKQLKDLGLDEAAKDRETVCADHDMPATQIATRLINKAGPGFLKWFLTCAQTGECHTNNIVEKAFGPDYKLFLENTKKLLSYEEEKLDLTDAQKELLVNQTTQIIDNNAEKLS